MERGRYAPARVGGSVYANGTIFVLLLASRVCPPACSAVHQRSQGPEPQSEKVPMPSHAYTISIASVVRIECKLQPRASWHGMAVCHHGTPTWYPLRLLWMRGCMVVASHHLLAPWYAN